jgi:hypothetical protein
MSYSIGLEIDTGGPEPAYLGGDWDYTSNCAPMWRRAGADLAEFNGRLAVDCLPLLESAIAHMKANPSVYEAMNPDNGWGSYAGLVPALDDLAASFRRHPKATVTVSR